MAVIRTTIDEAIARVDDWKGCNISYTQVTGGITNPNYKVDVDGKSFFLKIPGLGTDFIDRENCHEANVIADESGAGPKLYYYYPDTAVEISEWLDGYTTLQYGDLYYQDIFTNVTKNIAAFHKCGKILPLTQSLFEQAWDMNERAKQGSYLPPWHDRMEYLLHVTEDAFQNNGMVLTPCHGDFWSNNVMINKSTGDIKIIDYEYASMNDPYFDIGSISGTNYFTEAMDVEMIKIYHDGEFNELGFAKMKLYKIISDIKWAYWSLQSSINSEIKDFDYFSWYGSKIARLQHFMVDPRVDIWLNMLNNKPVFKA